MIGRDEASKRGHRPGLGRQQPLGGLQRPTSAEASGRTWTEGSKSTGRPRERLETEPSHRCGLRLEPS